MSDVAFQKCLSCIHWGTEQNEKDGIFFRACQKIKLTKGQRVYQTTWAIDQADEARKRKDIREVGKFAKDNWAVVTDVEDYSAQLKTTKDFGCILHEDKEH